MAALLEQLNSEIGSLVNNVRVAMVEIGSLRRGSGSGVILHSDGLIVTNAHVVRGHSPQVTLQDGRRFTSRLLGYDEENDLAALMVSESNLPTIEMGDTGNLQPGDWVFAMGHPWGLTDAVTAGVVVGLTAGRWGRNEPKREMIVVDLSLRPGYSGGPLVDSKGRLVGINTMMTGPEVGLAVPVHVVKRFLKEVTMAKDGAFV